MAVAPGPVTGATPSTSPRRTPAVGGEHRAGDVAGLRGRREGDDARDLLDSGGLAEGRLTTLRRYGAPQFAAASETRLERSGTSPAS